MQAQQALQQALREKLSELQEKNPKYSLRAFSNRLQINSGILSSVMSGKRRLSGKQIIKIANQLPLPPKQLLKIQTLVNLQSTAPEKNLEPLQISNDQFHLLSDAIHYSILALAETTDFSPSITWISQRLHLPQKYVEIAIKRLVRMHFIAIGKNGRWQLLAPTSKAGDGQASAAIKKYHEERLLEARDKLYNTDIADRDFFSTTIAVNSDQIALAKTMIRDFKKQLARALEHGPKNEVYRFSFQLFPVTKLQKRTLQ